MQPWIRTDSSMFSHIVLSTTLALLCLSTLLAPAAAQAPAPPSTAVQTQQEQLQAQCPVSLEYSVNLGQAQDYTRVPVFVATMEINNNADNVTLQTWRMAWQFPFSSIIQTPQDVFEPGVVLLTPNTNAPVLQSTNSSLAPGQSLQFSFLGTKGREPVGPENPYNVGAPQSVVFNNMVCSMINFPPGSNPQLNSAIPTTGSVAVSNATLLEVDYAPIEVINAPLETTATQFLIRVRNIQNASSIALEDIAVQYWYQGPDSLPRASEYMPWDYFEATCIHSNTPNKCSDVSLGISQGYPAVPGAHFALNITFNATAGALLPSGENAVPGLFLGGLGNGVDAVTLLLTITTRAGAALFNATEDYSFLDTPIRTDVPATSDIVPRQAMLNPRVPAYLNGQLVWGALPTPNQGGGSAVALSGNTSSNDGVFCQTLKENGQLSCSLTAAYCCVPVEAPEGAGAGVLEGLVSPVIPAIWPPTPQSQSQVPPGGQTPLLPSPGVEAALPLPPATSDNSALGGSPSTPSDASSNSTNKNNNMKSSGGSLAWIAGVAVGVAAVALLGATGGFIYLKRRHRTQLLNQSTKDRDEALKRGLRSSQGNEFNPSSFLGGSGSGSGSGFRADGGENGELSGNSFIISAGARSRSGGGGVGEYPSFVYSSNPTSNTHIINPQQQEQQQQQLGRITESSIQWSTGSTGSTVGAVKVGSRGQGGAVIPPYGVGTPVAAKQDTAGSLTSHLIRFPSSVSGMSGSDPNSNSRDLRGHTPIQSPFLSMPFYHTSPPSSIDDLREGNSLDASPQQQQQQQQQEQGAGAEKYRELDLIALLDKKASTTPGLFAPGHFHRQNSLPTLTNNPNPDPDHTNPDNDTDAPSTNNPNSGWLSKAALINNGNAIAAWQLRRSRTWDGVIHSTMESAASWSHLQRLKRRRTEAQLMGPLPPLTPLPPPLLPGCEAALDVDLNVQWDELEGKLGRCLGTGGFGAVYEATWRGKKVAVKMLPPFQSKDQHNGNGAAAYEALLREIELSSKFNCDRLVRVFGACTNDPNRVCLIMELMEGGSLSQRIYDRNKRRLSYLEILQLAHDVAAALAYLHPSVIHRDLKPQNVLMDLDGRAKLADFGISKVKDPTKSYLSQVTAENGTPMYMSPEQFNGLRIDEKADVYALGVILNEVYTRRQPWKDTTHFFQIILKVAINGERPWLDSDTPEPLRRLITKCWHQDPHMRPSCGDVMRLTDIMMQEEVRRWERLNTPGSGIRVDIDRLPSATKPMT